MFFCDFKNCVLKQPHPGGLSQDITMLVVSLGVGCSQKAQNTCMYIVTLVPDCRCTLIAAPHNMITTRRAVVLDATRPLVPIMAANSRFCPSRKGETCGACVSGCLFCVFVWGDNLRRHIRRCANISGTTGISSFATGASRVP